MAGKNKGGREARKPKQAKTPKAATPTISTIPPVKRQGGSATK